MAISAKNNPITNYFRTAYQELSRVVWPSREQAIRHTILVIVGSIIVAIFFGAVDYVFDFFLKLFINQF